MYNIVWNFGQDYNLDYYKNSILIPPGRNLGIDLGFFYLTMYKAASKFSKRRNLEREPIGKYQTSKSKKKKKNKKIPRHPKMGNYTLKFGKYKFVPIRNIPSDYLNWLIKEDVVKDGTPTRDAIDLVLLQRCSSKKI